MGLLDSIKNRVSSTVTQAKEAVSSTVQKVEDKASAAVQQVESRFETTPAAAPLPSAPVEQAASAAKPVSVSSPNLRAVLSANLDDSVKPPDVSAADKAEGKALYEKYETYGGVALDETGLATEMADRASKDPGASSATIRQAYSQLKGNHNSDDVAEAFTEKMSPDQLRTLAQNPDGAKLLEEMKAAMLSGYTSGHEKEMIAKITTAQSEAKTAPVKNTAVPEMKPGQSGVATSPESKATATGPISKEEWADPSKLVAKLTQNPASTDARTEQTGRSCGPSSMLASTLMASPEKAARFLESVAGSTDATTITSADRTALREVASKIRNKTASYEDLNKAQLLLFRAGNNEGSIDGLMSTLETKGMHVMPGTNPETGHQNNAFNNLSPAEDKEFRGLLGQESKWSKADAMRIQELFNRSTGMSMKMEEGPGGWAPKVEGDFVNLDASGFSDTEAKRLASIGKLKEAPLPAGTTVGQLADRLEPGQAVSFRVAGRADGGDSNHFVTVGRRDDGQLYLYNSDPDDGDATVAVGGTGAGSQEFRALLQSYEARQPADKHNGQKPELVPYRLD